MKFSSCIGWLLLLSTSLSEGADQDPTRKKNLRGEVEPTSLGNHEDQRQLNNVTTVSTASAGGGGSAEVAASGESGSASGSGSGSGVAGEPDESDVEHEPPPNNDNNAYWRPSDVENYEWSKYQRNSNVDRYNPYSPSHPGYSGQNSFGGGAPRAPGRHGSFSGGFTNIYSGGSRRPGKSGGFSGYSGGRSGPSSGGGYRRYLEHNHAGARVSSSNEVSTVAYAHGGNGHQQEISSIYNSQHEQSIVGNIEQYHPQQEGYIPTNVEKYLPDKNTPGELSDMTNYADQYLPQPAIPTIHHNINIEQYITQQNMQDLIGENGYAQKYIPSAASYGVPGYGP
eukprot:CAMPEP_0178910698 /NCGR_PEP_ID=MMETSP0786-20121207/9240_1 /TAXON_ID=186022 /ORGANISM="Thalassionema frauenfeldii, Strain CCMP 1798" /LENGTH=338 /DNA_ID=CAMNT_0020582975 /DNA_START=300 /DNA_END=1319 /DNA_ORIENTATION=+